MHASSFRERLESHESWPAMKSAFVRRHAFAVRSPTYRDATRQWLSQSPHSHLQAIPAARKQRRSTTQSKPTAPVCATPPTTSIQRASFVNEYHQWSKQTLSNVTP